MSTKEMEASNRYELFIMGFWGYAIKHISIDLFVKFDTEMSFPQPTIRLSTLILKPGFRGAGVGSQIIEYLKDRAGEIDFSLAIPVGVGNKKRIRNFYEKNGLTQHFDKEGFEYYIYIPKI